MKIILLLFSSFLMLFTTEAAPGSERCVACDIAITEKLYLMASPYYAERQPVCTACSQLRSHCSICQLPLKTNFVTLSDGRLLCPSDHRQAVFAADEAQQLFTEAKRAVIRMFAGTGRMPDQTVRMSLVDRTELESLKQGLPFLNTNGLTQGLTHSKMRELGQIEHEVYLLNGVHRSRFLAISAHEYAHAWLNENLPPNRKIESDTVEGFCELVAYRFMSELNDPFERQLILANDYSKGQVKVLYQAQETYRFYDLVKWMKYGTDPSIAGDDLNRLLVLGDTPATPLGWLPQVQSPVPERLVLKGISGTPTRRFALVNDQTLGKGEAAKVRVGQSRVNVRCMDVREKSVLLQVGENAGTTELFLEEAGRQ